MGKNNKARRAAKARKKAKARSRAAAGPGSGSHSPGGDSHAHGDSYAYADDVDRVQRLLVEATIGRREKQPTDQIVARLARFDTGFVFREVESVLDFQIDTVWQAGWQPAELVRRGRLATSTAAAARLMALAVSNDDVHRPASTLDPRWLAQVAALDLPTVNGRTGWVARWADDEGLGERQALEAVIDVLVAVTFLPPLEPLIPPPGAPPGSTWPPGVEGEAGEAQGADADPLLDTIRNLLAKAESSEFEAEATAFTAKAQELMTRHAIDAAVVASGSGGSGRPDECPVAIRVPVEAPYVDAKSLLLQVVAESSRCRTVFHSGLAMSTVVGFAADVSAVEMLFTSLLVQAQTALADAARHAPPGTRVRGQSYRSAFLLAFTERIGDRLAEINDAVVAEVSAEQGPSFLPVLRSRADSVDELMDRRFGDTVRGRVRGGYDAAGWASGRVAADSAQLAYGDVDGGSVDLRDRAADAPQEIAR